MQAPIADAMTRMGGLGEIALRLGAASVVGSILGVNRELHDKPAGVRTHALVSLGAALVTITGTILASDSGAVDATSVSRVIQGTITGVGFIGGGVILRDEHRMSVHGLTTAASVWVVACLGIVCGTGHYAVAFLALAMALAVLIIGTLIESSLRRLVRPPPGSPQIPEP